MGFKYDILKHLKKSLYNTYSKNTAKTYYNAVKKALEGQQFSSINEIDINKVLEYCKELKVKSRVAAVKHGLLGFKTVYPAFKVNELEFNNITKSKRNRRVKRFETLRLGTTLRRINKIDNEKLKIAYRLMFASGLRVSEISNLEGKDVQIDNDRLVIRVINGKGGKDRIVKTIPDKYLVEKLSGIIEYAKNNQKIFYKHGYMIRIAYKNKFRCHDLRRASAQIIYDSIDDKEKAIEAVQKHLGHSKDNTIYKKYLSRSIDFSRTKWARGGFELE